MNGAELRSSAPFLYKVLARFIALSGGAKCKPKPGRRSASKQMRFVCIRLAAHSAQREDKFYEAHSD